MDNTPTTLFESYEVDFKQVLERAKTRLEETGTTEQRKSALRRADIELDEAEELISQMEIEIPGMPASIRAQYSNRVKGCQTEVKRWRGVSKEVQKGIARDTLLGGSTSDNPYGLDLEASSDRQRLLAGTQSLADSTKRLEESHRLALESEEIGGDVLRSLRIQREQIEHSRDMLGGAERNVERSTVTLKGMVRTMYKQRFITGGIVAVLVLLIIFIVWRKLS